MFFKGQDNSNKIGNCPLQKKYDTRSKLLTAGNNAIKSWFIHEYLQLFS